MNREDDLKNLWEELRNASLDSTEADEVKESEDPEPKTEVELDSLLSRLEDIVSRLEELYGKKKEDEAPEEAPAEVPAEVPAEGNQEGEPSKEEAYVPRRVRRPLKNRV